ncbi:ATP-binding protein [Uliginosibacterium sp. 31-16]|uniref:two-component system sensor histidine kinase NtrB n=1 Tax=Uliginosibacterium sp. 31-16 TaxID=3068315 RepID=UPI00273D7B4C|nr:ATP-binding protein [Uliginosibacterium sp. 31-16]MDP5240398.1 ATP-binding protein [Uliginosibacterium sp. 31-16]
MNREAPVTAEMQSFMLQILDTITEGVLALDATHAITYANRAACYLLGYGADELITQNLHTCLQARRRDGSPYPAAESPFAWLARGGAFCFIEDVFWHKDGHALDVELTANPLPAQGGAIVIFRDIAERKGSQAALLKAFQDLDALNLRLDKAHGQLLQNEKLASVGQLAAGMAHEINNPIGFVSSNLSSLEKHVHALLRLIEHYEALEQDGSIPAERLAPLALLKQSIDYAYLRDDVQDLLSESRQGVERVRKIVKSLKDFSREGNEYQWSEIDLHHCLESTLDVLSREFSGRCELQRDYGDIPGVFCLASEINQVLMSVLLNAAQAIADRGRITLRTKRDGEFVVIEIQDTGCGIAADNMPHIFDPFFTTRPVGAGSGLGLSVAYGTVQRHGGDIKIDSAPGAGTTVRIILPIKPRHPPHTGEGAP